MDKLCRGCKAALERARVGEALPHVAHVHRGPSGTLHAVRIGHFFGNQRGPVIECWCGLRPPEPDLERNEGAFE